MALSCFDKACELLARRPHFRAELARKLAQRGHDPTAIAAALERLAELGYLDDAACARSLADQLGRRGHGPARLRAQLERRGAPREEAAAAVEAVFAEGEEPAARRAAERWLGRRAPGRGGRAALARHLDRKGYSSGTVLRLASELAGEDDD